MIKESTFTNNVKPIARFGLSAKGVVYCLLGIVAFMAAFNMGGQSAGNTDKQGILNMIENQTGGKVLLAIIALGLFSYSLWRLIQTFADTEDKGTEAKGLARRARYFFSGMVYTSLGITAVKIVFFSGSSSGKSGNQSLVQELLTKPFGQWLVGIAAAIIAGVGIYQVYYALSEKHRKHVNKAGGHSHKKLLLSSGKIGYIARGIVWLVISWLFAKAAIHSSSAQAGDTAKAFGWLQDSSYGAYLLGAVGLGLVSYGIFNFVRAKYESFN